MSDEITQIERLVILLKYLAEKFPALMEVGLNSINENKGVPQDRRTAIWIKLSPVTDTLIDEWVTPALDKLPGIGHSIRRHKASSQTIYITLGHEPVITLLLAYIRVPLLRRPPVDVMIGGLYSLHRALMKNPRSVQLISATQYTLEVYPDYPESGLLYRIVNRKII